MMISRSLLLLASLSFFACSNESGKSQTAPETSPREDSTRPQIICTFAPTAYLTQRLVEADADVRVDLPEEVDALFWSPDRELLAEYQGAALIVLNGVGMDTWAERANLPTSRTLRASANFADRWLEFAGSSETHRHGDGEEHRHVGLDPHVWLDPQLALGQARAIRGALEDLIAPEALAIRFTALETDLLGLHKRLQHIQPSGREVLTSHPAYEYLAARYGWALVALDLDPEAGWTPSLEAAVAGAVQDREGERRAVHLVWETAPQLEVATRLKAQFGIESWVADPAENFSTEEGDDWLDRQRAGAEVWERVLP